MVATRHITLSLHGWRSFRARPYAVLASRQAAVRSRIKASLLSLTVFGATATLSPRILAGQTWKVSAQPTTVIGADGDTTAQFTTIMGLARFTTGEIAVVNAMPFDIRLFSPSGKFVRRVARPGSGPGELGVVWWSGRSGDSLLTYDFSQVRITVFDVLRSKVTTIPFLPTKAPGRMLVNGFLANGSWLVGTWPPSLGPHADGSYRDSTTLAFWRSGVDGVLPVGTFPNLAFFADNSGPRKGSEYDLLSAHTTFLVVGNEVWVGVPETRSIAVYDATGKLARQVRVPIEPARFDAAELRRVRDRRLGTAKTAADSIRVTVMFGRRENALGNPAFSRLLLGRDGLVWIESFRVDRASSTEYVAIDRTGRVVGRLTGPPGVRFTEFGTNYALGIRKDENDVETVELFTLTK